MKQLTWYNTKMSGPKSLDKILDKIAKML